METITKKTREVGTSAGVLLPRSWLNRQVVVTLLRPSIDQISKDVMECLFERNLNEEVKGIYLFGSYARGDFDAGSDIDILILTGKTNKIINFGNYELLLVSEISFAKNLAKSLNYSSTIREAKVIFNKELIEKYKSKEYKFKAKKLLLEIERILKINEDAVRTFRDNDLNVPDGIVYSIVLRLRELYLIKCFFQGKSYFKKDFLKITGEEAYAAYLRIKRDEKELNNLSPEELISLINLSGKWQKELKEQKKELKA